MLRLYFGFPNRIADSKKIASIGKRIEDQYREGSVRIKGSETIRIKTKRLVKSCKDLIAKRKMCLKSQTEKQKQEIFHRSLYSTFEVAYSTSTQQTVDSDSSASSLDVFTPSNSDDGDSFSSQDAFTPSNSDDDDSDTEPDFHDSDNDPEYDPSEDDFSLRKKVPIPESLLKQISDSRGTYRLCENLLNAGVKIAGGMPSTYGISKSSLWTKITQLRSSQKNDLLSSLSNDTCKVIIQFDGKNCSRLNARHVGNEERLIILCHTNKGDVALGFFALKSKSGLHCAEQIIKSLAEHNLLNRVVGLVCDTESTNTGIVNGACALVERSLEEEILHFMCRHHSKEVILKEVFVAVFGGSQASYITTFDTLIVNWDRIRQRGFAYSPICEEKCANNQLLKDYRQEALDVITKHASNKSIREDYAELNDLVLKFLGKKTSKPFRVPGATNNARWMARIIYAIKTYLFRQHLDEDPDFIESLERFCLFVTLIYTKHWNRCPNAIDAPINDLLLMKELDAYKIIDIEIANAALRAHNRHLWYLSDELAALSVFSNKVSNEVKFDMIAQMTPNVEARTENSIKHSTEIDDIQNIQLYHFISPRSRFLFERLELNVDFLNEHPDNWNQMESYENSIHTILDLITVVNDSAERAVQLGANTITDKRVQSEERLQDFIISTYSMKY